MERDQTKWLPSAKLLGDWLDLSEGSGVEDLLEQTLLTPLCDFLQRPSKNFRGRLVQIGFDLVADSEAHPNRHLIPQAMVVLEAIHAASLVVDDIQDNSEQRRGQPTLHKKYGLAVALNSANWLYFWPLEMAQRWPLSAELKVKVVGACHRALIKAHSGQALDVGTPVSQLERKRVKAACLASLELKTGALTALALELGALLGGGSEVQMESLCQFGVRFGVALQMFDDLGNIKARMKPDPKRFEDLKGERPSWLWASASQFLNEEDYQEFIEVVRTLPNESKIESYFHQAQWPKEAKAEAVKFLNEALNKLNQTPMRINGSKQISELADILKRSYE
jgi:geranylgeranyl pyrophosphate synthase